MQYVLARTPVGHTITARLDSGTKYLAVSGEAAVRHKYDWDLGLHVNIYIRCDMLKQPYKGKILGRAQLLNDVAWDGVLYLSPAQGAFSNFLLPLNGCCLKHSLNH